MNTSEKKYLNTLGERIRMLRLEKGVDQKQFAFECEISRTQLYSIEKGVTNPRLITLLKISKGLEITLSELLTTN